MAGVRVAEKPLRVPRDAVDQLKSAAAWIGKLNGTDDPQGQTELREEVQNARKALSEIEAAL